MRYAIALLFASLTLPAQAEPLRVVTGTPVVHALASMVMGDTGDPEVLLDRGADPHGFQLRPSQARVLERADAVFWVGPQLTPWLSRAIDSLAGEATVVELLKTEGLHGVTRQEHGAHAHGDDAHGHEEDAGHGHEDGAHGDDDAAHDHDGAHGHENAADHDAHAHDGPDPHAWLNTENARLWLDEIAHKLSKLDPANATDYAENAAAADARIAELTADIRATLAPAGGAPIVVFHDAYGHFAAQFDLDIAGAISFGDAARPGAARLSELRELITRRNVVCVFPEVQHSPRHVSVAIEGTDARVGAPLDPSGTSLTYGAGLYEDLMRGLAGTIADCVANAE